MAKAKHFAPRGSKNRQAQSKKQSFLHGALILTLSIVIVKLIGMLFKVPLTWIITEEGMGYFGTAYNFSSPIFSLATAGFPIAISKMVSENYTKGNFRDIGQIHRGVDPDLSRNGRRRIPCDVLWRPDLCEYHQRSAFALCDVGAFSGDPVQLSLFHLPRIL